MKFNIDLSRLETGELRRLEREIAAELRRRGVIADDDGPVVITPSARGWTR